MNEIRRARVLNLMQDGLWHSTMEINNIEVGGSEGCRRLRELRKEIKDGKHPQWDKILIRKKSDKSSQYEYKFSSPTEKIATQTSFDFETEWSEDDNV